MATVLSPRGTASTDSSDYTRPMTEDHETESTLTSKFSSSVYTSTTATSVQEINSDTTYVSSFHAPVTDSTDPRKVQSRHELSSRHSSASRPSSKDTSTRKAKSVIWLENENVSNNHSDLIHNITNNLSPSLLNEFERKKRNKEKKVEQRLLALHREKRNKQQEEREAAIKLERKLPMDVLAKEWFNSNPASADLRVYLIEKLMPTLILGLEKILLEADKRGLLLDDLNDNAQESDRFGSTGILSRPRFNPVNELAQYLMRNNPKFSNYPESSQYARGLHAVAEELKHEVFDLDSNKLAKLKYEAEKNRKKLEENVRRIKEEKEKRENLLKNQFETWLLDDTGKLHLQLIQNAIFSFLEIAAHVSPEKEVKLSKELGPTDETGATLTADEYIKFIDEFVQGQPADLFEDILRHLDQCALAFRKTFEHEMWNTMFLQLFSTLDTESTGYLDRHRMLHLLEKFWDKTEEKDMLRNPRKWPVIELEELDDLYPESDDESVIVSTQIDSVTIPSYEGDEEKVSIEWGKNETSSSPTEKETFESETENIDFEATINKDDTETAEEETDRIDQDEIEPEEESKQDEHVIIEEAEKTEVDGEDVTKDKEATKEDGEAVEKIDVDQPQPAEDAAEKEEKPEIEENQAENKEEKDETGGEGDQKDDKNFGNLDEDNKDGKDGQEKIRKQSAADDPVEEDTEKHEKTSKEGGETGETENAKEEEKVDSETDNDVEKNAENTKDELEDMKKRLLNTTGQGVTLTTPAVTEDEPVKIQFSSEPVAPEPKVRKTTSLTVVHKKKPTALVDDDKTKMSLSYAGAGDAPIQPTVSDIPDATDSEGPVSNIDSTAFLVQHTEADMTDDEHSLFPIEVKTRPASASRMSVTFAAEPIVLPGKPSQEFFSEYSSRSQSRMTSVFDENKLNKNRFLALLETFLDEDTQLNVVEELVNFIYGGYIETEEEKMERLAKARRDALSAKHRDMIDNLFNKWDNDGKGYIDIDEVEDTLSKYKGGMEAMALKQGRVAVRQSRKHHVFDKRINRKEFSLFINTVCNAMVGGEEVFDGLVEFATTTVERTYAERVRGEARRKWLGQIQTSAECSGASMDPVYRAIFQTVFKDAEAHGGQKKASAYIALLENNMVYPERGNLLLRYVACTPDNAPHMLGKAFYEDMRGISFYCVRRGKLVHVPRVRSHGRVYFWNPARLEEEKEGSLILLPLKDEQRRIFGVMGIDNLDDPADRSVFATHELNFYQGIARGFSSAFHHVDLRRKLLRIIDSAMSWIHSRAPKVASITIYFVEPDPKSVAGHVLRKMMRADNNTGITTIYKRPSRLYRKDNLFRDYLFKCMESSETTTADAYGEHHTAYPLRDDEGRCQTVVDMSIGKLRTLPSHERREIQRMLKLLQEANREVMRESIGGEKKVVLQVEENASDETRVEVMFDRLMLTDLRDNVNILDNNVFAELHNYKDPPIIIHSILKAVLMLFYQDKKEYEQFEDWVKCKQLSTTKLKQQIVEFDPTANGAVTPDVHEALSGMLKGIAHGAVAKHGSRPAQQLYNWAFVCLSLIEHTKKMADSYGQPAITPVNSASTATTDTTNDGSEMY